MAALQRTVTPRVAQSDSYATYYDTDTTIPFPIIIIIGIRDFIVCIDAVQSGGY